jgi:hypothetical protein
VEAYVFLLSSTINIKATKHISCCIPNTFTDSTRRQIPEIQLGTSEASTGPDDETAITVGLDNLEGFAAATEIVLIGALLSYVHILLEVGATCNRLVDRRGEESQEQSGEWRGRGMTNLFLQRYQSQEWRHWCQHRQELQ